MKRLYWTNPDDCEVEVEVKSVGDRKVTIDPIVFHPDEGGQPADKGRIGESEVLNVEIIDGTIIHTLDKSLSDGKYVARVDQQHRLHVARRHTAQHIISGIAGKRFDLKTVGVHIGLESCTVDFDKKIDFKTAQAIERDSMEVVAGNIPVETVFNDTDVRTRFDLKEIESEMIRVAKIGNYDASACCGTHVRRTGDIGIIRILDLESKKNGTRVSFTAGTAALEFSQNETSILKELRQLSKCSTAELPVILRKALESAKNLNKQLERLQGIMLPGFVESASVVEIDSSKVGIQIDAVTAKLTGKLAALIANEMDGTGIVISDGSIAINSKTLNAGELLKILHKAVGGKGGGSVHAASGRLDKQVTTEQVIEILKGGI
ncbi:MAG: alanyl-tRNA editing protein [Planctomycetota bacterium]|jgi:alanyl-tRNA synthetase